MSFIYGIINFDGESVRIEEIDGLASSVKWEGFLEQTKRAQNYALGYCFHPEREAKAGFFKINDIIVLADIRIYNVHELKQSIDFTHPVEAFAKAYLKWGLQCANFINGDFAAVVMDINKKECHLFKDHIGSRPLSYYFHKNQLIFASHEFGLVQSTLVKTRLSEEKFINDFFKKMGNYHQTVFENLYKVKPGYSISFVASQLRENQYWRPELIHRNKWLSFDQAVIKLRQLLINATIQRMESGKIGVHVSGGIDSTGIASVLADYASDKSQLIGYSWTPEQLEGKFKGVNEKEFIEAFSKEKQIAIRYLKLEENEFSKDSIIPEFESMYIEHPTMKIVEKDGVNTLFSGWGGDEFVSLSTRGTLNHLFFSFKWRLLLKYIKHIGLKSGVFLFIREVLPLFIPFGLLKPYKAQITIWFKIRLLKTGFVLKYWKKIFFNNSKNIFGYGNRNQFMLNLLTNYHIPERMDSWSIFSEKYGFEYKYPLLDKVLLEFWFSIPIEYTFEKFKSRLLYREAMRGILIEKIRMRNEKGEGMRIAYTFNNIEEGNQFIRNLISTIPQKEHLPFFYPDLLNKFLKKSSKKSSLKDIIRMQIGPFYLRYVYLLEKYLR